MKLKVNNTEKQIKINFIFFKLNCKINIQKKAEQEWLNVKFKQ